MYKIILLRKQIITVNTPDETGVDANNKVMMCAAIADEDNKTINFAKKCANVCSQQSRKMGATRQNKSKKRK